MHSPLARSRKATCTGERQTGADYMEEGTIGRGMERDEENNGTETLIEMLTVQSRPGGMSYVEEDLELVYSYNPVLYRLSGLVAHTLDRLILLKLLISWHCR